MVKIISDKYVLGQSQSKTITNMQKEIKLDINLKLEYKEITGAIAQGVVKDEKKNPLKGALIQLISDEHEFIMHTTTDVDGSYNLDNIPLKNNCKLYALYPNKKIPTGVKFTPKPFETTNINFDLEVDPLLKLSIITGTISDFTTEEPIKEAVLYLYSIKDPNKIKDSSNEILVSIVRSNNEGYFTFSEIAIGNYVVKATKLGYKVQEALVRITEQPQILNLGFKIIINESIEEELGEISGIVKDERQVPISNIDVVLYRIKPDNSEIPVAYTQTNNEGLYIFKSVSIGTYKVKSNKIKIVSIGNENEAENIISPNFNEFIISRASTYIKTEHDVTIDKIQLSNGAIIQIDNIFATADKLGGSNTGIITMFVNIPIDGFYIMSIKYISEDKARSFRLKINNEIDNRHFLTEKTNGIRAIDAKVVSFLVTLKSGENIIEFYNIGESAPKIRKTTYELYGEKETINATKGRLFGVMVGLEESFVIGIGGPFIGSSDFSKKAYFELDFYVAIANEYLLLIEYISGDEDRPLRIDVNGINSGGTYMVPKTDGWMANNAKKFIIPVNLKEGRNTIKFYSKKDFVGPNIGDVTCRTNFVTNSLDITKAILSSGAILDKTKDMIGNLGGFLRGSMIFSIFPKILGTYNMFFSCLSSTYVTQLLKIDVNGINIGEFFIAPTGTSKLEYVVQITLDADENIIKFYNDDIVNAPYIGDVKIALAGLGLINTNLTRGILNYGATLSYKGAMVNLGGGKKSAFLPLNTPVYGYYKSTISFIVGDENGASVSLYINDSLYNVVNLPKTFTSSINDSQEFIVKSKFKGKDDSITFLNHDSSSDLNIGKITIQKQFAFIIKYDLENIELLNGAALVNNMIINIGKHLGIIRLNVEVPKSGKYDLAISYVAETNDTKSQLSANFILPDINLDFEATNSMNKEDSKTKVVTLELVQGLNIIQIYNS